MQKQIWLETIILENMALVVEQTKRVLINKQLPNYKSYDLPVNIPPEAKRGEVDYNHYIGYRAGKVSACADVVCVKIIDGMPVVPLILRTKPPFANCWWIMGGAIPNFRPLEHFLLWKIFKEGGLFDGSIDEFVKTNNLADNALVCRQIKIVGCLGVYRTATNEVVDGNVCDTIQPCYMAILPSNFNLEYDGDHSGVKWFREEDLLPSNSCNHWYSRHVALRAIEATKKARGLRRKI